MEIKIFPTLLLLSLLASCSGNDEAKQENEQKNTDSSSQVSAVIPADSAAVLVLAETNMGDETYTDIALRVNGKEKELGERSGKYVVTGANDPKVDGLVDENAHSIYKSETQGILSILFLVENDSEIVVTEGVRDELQAQMMYNELYRRRK